MLHLLLGCKENDAEWTNRIRRRTRVRREVRFVHNEKIGVCKIRRTTNFTTSFRFFRLSKAHGVRETCFACSAHFDTAPIFMI